MRKGRLWRALLGVERTVVQRVELDETAAEPTVVAHVRPVAGSGRAAGCAGGAAPAMTRAPGGAGGGRWTWAPCK